MDLTEKIVETSLYEGRSYMSKSGRKRWSQHVIWDDGLAGFGLRISSTNRKSYVISYEDGGRKRTKTLGRADRLSLDEARRRAMELLPAPEKRHSTDDGAEPVDGAEPIDGIETVAQLADAYLERHLKSLVPSWFADQRLIQIHIKPALGRSAIADVTPTDLANLSARVGQRFPDDARRLRLLLDGMFDWAAERGLWSRRPGQRREGQRQKNQRRKDQRQTSQPPRPQVDDTEPETAPSRSAEELTAALRHSEAERSALAARLDEVSVSGTEMLRKLNEQAAKQTTLAAELAESRRELKRAAAEAARSPDPAKTEKQMSNLRRSVEQLMDSVNRVEGERDAMAERLAEAEARAERQSVKVTSLARLRNDLESKLLEEQRNTAIRRVQRQNNPSRWRGAALLAAGLVAGVLLTLLLQRAMGPDDGAIAHPSARPPAGAAADTRPPLPTEPSANRDADGEAAEAAGNPAAPAAGEPAPDLAAAAAAVGSWAAAWSEQRVEEYLAFYAAEFAPPDGLRRGEWASQRRNRILRPGWIRVTLADLRSTVLDNGRVSVSFSQSYETATYSDWVDKTLELVWENGGWKIAAERSG